MSKGVTEPADVLHALAAAADGKIVAVFTGTVFITEDAHEAPNPARV